MKLIQTINSILESLSRARAATYLARMGHYDLAKKVMTGQA
jgi:hypothetical protein